MDTKKVVSRLLYLRKEIDNTIDNFITEDALRDREVDADKVRDRILYQLDEQLEFLRQER